MKRLLLVGIIFYAISISAQDSEYLKKMQIDLVNLGGKHIKPNKVTTKELLLKAKGKLYLDGGSDTYIYEHTANMLGLVAGGTMSLDVRGSRTYSKDFYPDGGNTRDLGDATFYWREVHCKDIVDYSRKTPKDNVLAALKKLKHEDKTTYPSDVYLPAKIADKACEIDGKKYKKGDKIGKDGTMILQMIPYLVDAIKELDERINELEKENSKLKKLTGGTNGTTK